jgi:hypothetical protein
MDECASSTQNRGKSMAETKDDIAAERDRLRAENESLRAQLSDVAAGGAAVGRAAVPAYRFQLSEGDRQEVAIRGGANINGRWMTKDEIEAAMAAAGPDDQGHNDQSSVELPDAPDATKVTGPRTPRAGGVEGVDYVWPSVAPGVLDPAVAGTPGVSGPSAADVDPTVAPTVTRTEV